MTINNETRVGIFIVLAVVVLAVLTWRAGDFDFRNGGYEIKVHFKNIDGVALNAPVTVNGLEVGRISDINILYGKQTIMEVTLWLRDSVKLHEGAQASIKNLGFLGEKYIGLTTGNDGRPFLHPGETITGEEPPSFDKLLDQGDRIAVNLESISSHLNKRLEINAESIDSIIANLDIAVRDAASISSKIRAFMETNNGSMNRIMSHVEGATQNMEEMTFDLKENPWKLLYKEKTR